MTSKSFCFRTTMFATVALASMFTMAHASLSFETSVTTSKNVSAWPTNLGSNQSNSVSASASGKNAELDMFGSLFGGGQPMGCSGIYDGTMHGNATFKIDWTPGFPGDTAPASIQVIEKRSVRAEDILSANAASSVDGCIWLTAQTDLNTANYIDVGVGSIGDHSYFWTINDSKSTNGNYTYWTFSSVYLTLYKNAGSNTYTLNEQTDNMHINVNAYMAPASTYGDAGAGTYGEVSEKVNLTIVG